MNKFEKDPFSTIPESKGRKGLPVDRSPQGFHADREDEVADLKEKEREALARGGKAFVPIEEVMDPASQDIEDPLAWMDEMDDKEWNQFMSGSEENLTELISQAPRQIPPEVKAVFRRNALPPKLWESMTSQQQGDWKAKIRKEIEVLYLTTSKKFVHRKERKDAA